MIDKYINQYGKRLYGLCLTLCANSTEAEDLYQDTWIKALENISRYDKTKEFEPWLTRICVNTYRNIFRRFTRSPFWDKFSSVEEKEAVINAIPTETVEDYNELHEAINRLPEKFKITIILFYFKDLDINATAQALGIPPGTVKSRLSKSKKLLREALKYEADIQF